MFIFTVALYLVVSYYVRNSNPTVNFSPRLHPNNVLGIRTFADTLSCSTLVEATNRYIQKYFIEVSHSEEFINLQFSDVKEIISSDELHITSEEQVKIVFIFSLNDKNKFY